MNISKKLNEEMENETNKELESAYEIDIIKYAACRKREIDLLRQESFLSKQDKNKSLFQLLPRHMRRRAMGYIRKRLPHRIRKAAIIKPPEKQRKRPSRKYRRRANILLKEYERRKRAEDDKMWLETHIWHAKRFHMSDSLYGYRLALHDNCKCKRAVYKCLRGYCCVHVILDD
jgi:ribonuclease P/MRP protein subunit POP1